jgi:hypothetical protein
VQPVTLSFQQGSEDEPQQKQRIGDLPDCNEQDRCGGEGLSIIFTKGDEYLDAFHDMMPPAAN